MLLLSGVFSRDVTVRGPSGVTLKYKSRPPSRIIGASDYSGGPRTPLTSYLIRPCLFCLKYFFRAPTLYRDPCCATETGTPTARILTNND